MKEIWKDIPNYEGYYQVSNMGRVRSITREVRCRNYKTRTHYGKVLKNRLPKRGYHTVALSKENKTKSKQVHQLVGICFIENPNNYDCIDHMDSNVLNNIPSNLQWCTASQNAKFTKERNRYHSKISIDDVKKVKVLLNQGYPHRKLAKMFNVSKSAITRINTGETWSEITI